MALPKLQTTKHDLVIPSTGETIQYRPFLVKEQKVLMIAQETGSQTDMANALIDIVNACTFDVVEADKLATFDIEYMFLKIRSKSVGSTVSIKVPATDDPDVQVPVEINLDELEVTISEESRQSSSAKITDNITVNLGYPTMKEIVQITNPNSNSGDLQASQIFDIVKLCVVNIEDHADGTIYERQDFSDEELNEFIESLDSSQFEKIQNFFENMPKLSHTVKVTNPNTGVEGEQVIEGLANFLE